VTQTTGNIQIKAKGIEIYASSFGNVTVARERENCNAYMFKAMTETYTMIAYI
jgi:hypothetical protein